MEVDVKILEIQFPLSNLEKILPDGLKEEITTLSNKEPLHEDSYRRIIKLVIEKGRLEGYTFEEWNENNGYITSKFFPRNK